MSPVTITKPREAVAADAYQGIDFDDFNRGVEEYRALTREHGFSTALSHYAGEPVLVRTGRSD
jgi:hypothetical protein